MIPHRLRVLGPEHGQVLYSITKHAMRRNADETGATSISFRPKVFSDRHRLLTEFFPPIESARQKVRAPATPCSTGDGRGPTTACSSSTTVRLGHGEARRWQGVENSKDHRGLLHRIDMSGGSAITCAAPPWPLGLTALEPNGRSNFRISAWLRRASAAAGAD